MGRGSATSNALNLVLEEEVTEVADNLREVLVVVVEEVVEAEAEAEVEALLKVLPVLLLVDPGVVQAVEAVDNLLVAVVLAEVLPDLPDHPDLMFRFLLHLKS